MSMLLQNPCTDTEVNNCFGKYTTKHLQSLLVIVCTWVYLDLRISWDCLDLGISWEGDCLDWGIA
jgi:hypothetical protein